ncbi:MAG: glutathione S-transferase [Pseudomonadota bacterium]
MTYDLFIGDRSFSSWSMRGWLMLKAFDLPHKSHLVGLYGGTMAQDLEPLAPARLVPVLRTPEGHVLQDTLAMGETLAERHPEAGLWPKGPAQRAKARWLVAEMHSGFGALRDACPMNLRTSWQGFEVAPDVRADLERIEALWDYAFEDRRDGWLFGDYSLADVFYAPIAARIAGYGLPVGLRAQAYVDRHLANPLFRQWRAMGETVNYDFEHYAQAVPKSPWPGPAILEAEASEGPSVKSTCPYSGDPVTHYLRIGEHAFGFCNAFCRDKTLHDPLAWPAFAKIYEEVTQAP